MILGADGDSRCAFKNLGQIVKTCFLCSETEESILNYRILNAGFTELFTKSRIIGNVNTLVVNNNACYRTFEQLGKFSDLLFLLL